MSIKLRIHLTEVATPTRLFLEKVESYVTATATGATAERGALPLELRSSISGSGTIESFTTGFSGCKTAWDANMDLGGTDVRCAGHAFLPGQAIKIPSGAGPLGLDSTITYYLNVIDENRLTLHLGELEAMAGTSAKVATGSGGISAFTMVPVVYSGAPMPSGREGVVMFNRLVIAASKDHVAISDPADFLHFTPFSAARIANLGEATPITALVPMGEDMLLLMKEDAVLGVGGLSGASTGFVLKEVTREYGCGASLSAVSVGTDVWFLSMTQKGVASVRVTETGTVQGVTLPVSAEVQRTFAGVDWGHAAQAAAAWFGNRYMIAVPMKDQTGPIKNNAVIVYNFLTQGWEGIWSGATLDVVQFTRHVVSGQLRLCFLSADGRVRFFDESALTDMGVDIPWRVVTRGYTAQAPTLKYWRELTLTMETWRPRMTVRVIPEGVGEVQTLRENITLDREKSFKFNAEPVSMESQAPYREDYSLLAGDEGLVAGEDVFTGVFQAVTVAMRGWSARDRSLKVELSGDRGSVRIRGLLLEATMERPAPAFAPN